MLYSKLINTCKMGKIDFKKEIPGYKSKEGKPELLTIPAMNYLKIDGYGDPNHSIEFQQAIEALYTVAYTLKFMIKKQSVTDYGVAPLEGLWWADDMNDFLFSRKENWKWTAMIMQPEYVTDTLYKDAIKAAAGKKELPALKKMRLESLDEGLCVQVLYTGPYADEGPTIQSLHQFAKDNGCLLTGKHHEIYLNDQRKTAPEKLKTIIRQPVVVKR